MKPRRAAEAARTLAWMAMRMPSWPTRSEKHGAHDEGDRPADGDDDLGALLAEFGHGLAAGRHDVDAQEQGHGQDPDDGQDLPELGLEVAVGADADGVPDLLHLSRALVLLEDHLAQHPGVPEADEGRQHDAADGDLLERVQPVTGQAQNVHACLLNSATNARRERGRPPGASGSAYFTHPRPKINPGSVL
ncbi:MAG: hypothetical protein MZU84_06120 [Sphingobacterium sp.]|nr:hypothetical protein [Sphingobacterium sp.]